jgi:peptide/nickel transport system ATP-binding protein
MSGATPIVAFREVHKHFTPRAAMFGAAVSVKAVDGVSFEVGLGRVLGIAGESGSGKSTLANLLVGLERATTGEIVVDGHRMRAAPGKRLRRAVQMVFQDPLASLNPRFTVGRSVEEPLLIHGMGTSDERRVAATAALERAELRPAEAFMARYPHELSGGQRQRVAIARAVVLRPKLLVADEPVSMLDVSVRAGILRLLKRLVTQERMAMVFITHDLSIVAHICDELAIMYRGRIVELGPVRDVLSTPAHPYTRALIDAVPIPHAGAAVRVLPAKLLAGAATMPSAHGCRFAPRCVHAVAACEDGAPPQVAVGLGHVAACLRARELRERDCGRAPRGDGV